jgi:hypothetical protein
MSYVSGAMASSRALSMSSPGHFEFALAILFLFVQGCKLQLVRTIASSEAAPGSGSATSDTTPPTATYSGQPSDPSYSNLLDITVAGADVISYQYKVGISADCSNATGYSADVPVSTHITDLTATTGTYTLCIRGKDAAGNLQTAATATTYSWNKNVAPLTVEKLYPNNGEWMDYVVNSGTGTVYNQSDTSCNSGTTGNYTKCIHGGEKRRVVATGATSCTNLTITDARAAFDWICDDSSGTPTFYMVGLKSGKGLRDLIDPATSLAFYSNSVTVQLSGSTIGTSATGIWWSNGFAALPDNSASTAVQLAASGSSVGRIYTLAVSRLSNGYVINHPELAVVTMPGVTLGYYGGGTNGACNSFDGLFNTSGDRTVVCIGATEFAWVEAVIDSFPAGASARAIHGIGIFASKFSRVHNTSVTKTGNNAWTGQISINDSNAITLSQVTISTSVGGTKGILAENDCAGIGMFDITVSNSDSDGISIKGTEFTVNRFKVISNNGAGLIVDANDGGHRLLNGLAANNASTGIQVQNPTGVAANLFYSIVSYNNGNHGFAPGALDISTQILATNNGGAGVYLSTSNRGVLQSVTSVNNATLGLSMSWNTANFTSSNLLLSNNGLKGLSANNSSVQGIFANIVATNNFSSGIELADAGAAHIFTRTLMEGNNGAAISALANSGLINLTSTDTGADGSSTYTGQSSNAVLRTPRSIASSFVGKVSTTDASNSSNANGTQAFASISDWFNFSNAFRTWGRSGSAFPAANNQDTCSSGTCQIWDWSLVASASVVRGNSADGDTQNTAITPGATCPSQLDGTVTLTDQATSPRTFLLNAYELVDDPTHNSNGNNNGLCESNEGCMYMPNFGAYQGHGDPFAAQPCTIQPGTLSNISVYSYPTNGR